MAVYTRVFKAARRLSTSSVNAMQNRQEIRSLFRRPRNANRFPVQFSRNFDVLQTTARARARALYRAFLSSFRDEIISFSSSLRPDLISSVLIER